MFPLYPFKTITIILIDIAFKNYSIDSVIRHLKSKSFLKVCFSCQCSEFKIHSKYVKYFYHTPIPILRVRCKICRKTHAVIPSFSLPGTSIGTKEAEQVLFRFEQGKSLYSITRDLFPAAAESGYVRQLIHNLLSRIRQAKALFPDHGEHSLQGLSWIESVIGKTSNPVYEFNRFCLSRGFNCLICTRVRFIGIQKNTPGSCISHNSTATGFT